MHNHNIVGQSFDLGKYLLPSVLSADSQTANSVIYILGIKCVSLHDVRVCSKEQVAMIQKMAFMRKPHLQLMGIWSLSTLMIYTKI